MQSEKIFHIIKSILEIIYQWLIGCVFVFVPRKFRFKSIENDLILITGSGSGLGQRLAFELAKLNAHILICDYNENNLTDTKKFFLNEQRKLKRTFKVNYYKCDVTKLNELSDLREKISSDTGGKTVTMLINNAGVVNGKKLLDLTEKEIVNIMNVNVLASFWTTKTFLPDMIKNNFGHIIQIASVAGLTGVAGLTDYCASKYAVIGFHESLKYELMFTENCNVKTTVICPWFINTGMFDGAKSEIMKFLELDTVVKEIISGILINQEIILIPKLLYILNAMKSFLPTKAIDAISRLFEADAMMTSFRGRS